jgi:hypothetical protein
MAVLLGFPSAAAASIVPVAGSSFKGMDLHPAAQMAWARVFNVAVLGLQRALTMVAAVYLQTLWMKGYFSN